MRPTLRFMGRVKPTTGRFSFDRRENCSQINPTMLRPLQFATASLFVSFAATAFSGEKDATGGGAKGVQITELTDHVRVEINGRLFTEYFFKDVPRPYFYPLIGPGEAPMTRNWPMKNTPDEEHDHPHHRSLWFTHGSVNGQDFWSEEKAFGKIVHDGFIEIRSGAEFGTIKSRDKWVAADGTTVCTDERTIRIYTPKDDQQRM